MASSDLSASAPSVPSLKRRNSARSLFSRGMSILAFLCAIVALIPLVAVLSYVLINGIARLGPAVFTELPPPPLIKGGGFGNAVVGTLLTVGIAALLSIPFGVLAAIFLSEFARDTKVASIVNFFTNVLSGVPSIVIGVFAYGLVVLSTGTFSSVAGGVALGALMLPTIVRTSEEALESVPSDYRQAAIGLGATNFHTVFHIVLPAALPAIVTGILLAIARAAGETAPVLFTALFNQYWTRSLWEPTATLSMVVYNFATVPYKNQQELAWTASLVLVMLVFLTSLFSRWATRRRR